MILENGEDISFKDWTPQTYSFTADTEASLADNEKQYIESTLQKTNGKVFGKGGAAEMLQINPKTLMSRMKKLGIQRK